MKSDADDMDPLMIRGWFKKPYSVTITTIFIFFAVLYNAWSYVGKWLDSILINGLVLGDVTFIKTLTFVLILLMANIIYMVLNKQVALLRTVEEQEKQLIMYEMKFQNFIDTVPDVAVQGFDLDGSVHYWNLASEKMYGYKKDEVMGQKMFDLIVPEESRDNFENILSSMQNNREYKQASESIFLAKDGRKLPVFSSYSTVPASDDLLEIFSMEIDLTERKQMEHDLNEAKIIAEASSNAKSKFLASMSHELRTPLNSIIGFSDILANDHSGCLSDDHKRYANNISTSGQHLLGIINDILDISKAEAGKMELQYEPILLPSVINEVVEAMRPSTSVRNISINTIITPNVGIVKGDLGKLKQILYNLVGNAAKFSNDDGTIIVRCDMDDKIVQLEVEDDGIGIKEEDIGNLFKPFSQVGELSTKKHKGTGLGLSLVRELVELHKGEVWVKSEYGKYSIFGFNIPVDNSLEQE
ncbi:PAS domain-containing sensor histidine kinase [Methanolobus profundi]|uniref:histidine kinase n=1 Tax=Methanolobus profundi TaxID=487685 RepID=A0A1I4PEM0_9EURY|nr:PAS domain-containing hybrid sensor histidine kinase/response regulator [Methanolobus profundi]SFM26212.1 PAS domain S-box-containing protein [Methanolobus profundi]